MSKTCKALFDFTARKSSELSLKKGETITNVKVVTKDWYKGRNAVGEVGVFPSTYVVMIDVGKVMKQCVAKYDYDGGARSEGKLCFSKGDRIAVLAEVSPDWWTGSTKDGRTGLFPAKFVAEELRGTLKFDSAQVASALAASRASNSTATSATVSPAHAHSASLSTAPPTFASPTLRDFPIAFKMPRRHVPTTEAKVYRRREGEREAAARREAEAKLRELSTLLTAK
uniref:SH3 domain-containing protein n=1 Tax=Sexangularia sp. CB-2014 TaxID=1486929 RepID=A0A7S1YFE2_9EUKA